MCSPGLALSLPYYVLLLLMSDAIQLQTLTQSQSCSESLPCLSSESVIAVPLDKGTVTRTLETRL